MFQKIVRSIAVGSMLLADLQNSHMADFQRVAPKTVEDCDRLVVERLKALLP